jgi:hypothetical protein
VSAAGQKRASAGAHHFDFIVGRVSLCLHFPSIRQVPARASQRANPWKPRHIAGRVLILLDSADQPQDSALFPSFWTASTRNW